MVSSGVRLDAEFGKALGTFGHNIVALQQLDLIGGQRRLGQVLQQAGLGSGEAEGSGTSSRRRPVTRRR